MTTPNPQTSPTPPRHQSPPQPSPLTTSITQLRNLSSTFTTFLHHFDDLQNHLDLLHTSLDSKLSHSLLPTSPNSDPDDQNNEDDVKEEPFTLSHLRHLCTTMNVRSLRKHILSRLQPPTTLGHELTQALKSSPDPSNLVLQCFGKACLQSHKAFLNDPLLIPRRKGCVLLLESFLLMGDEGVEIQPKVRLEAEAAAGVWRNRLITGGGLGKACDVDARGLLVMIVCFGVPRFFSNEDVGDLFWAGNLYKVKEVYAALLKHSAILNRIKGIVEASAKHKMEIEALNMAYTIGISFSPQKLLTSFLKESTATWEKARKNAHGSTATLKKANKKHLADLNSVEKLLKDHNIDAVSGWQIDEKILRLKKEIDDLDTKVEEKVKPKRRSDATESSKRLKTHEAMPSRFAGRHLESNSPYDGSPKRKSYATESSKWLKTQDAIPSRFAGHLENKSPYDDGLIPMNLNHGLPVRTSTYSASPSVLHGPGAISLRENITGLRIDHGRPMFATEVGAGISAGISGVTPISAYASGGQTMNRDDQPYGWHRDTSLNERLGARDFSGQIPSVGLTSLYSASSSSLDGFAGLSSLSSIGVLNRSSASDLYQFADVVMESETYRTSGSRLRTLPPSHRSSYLY